MFGQREGSAPAQLQMTLMPSSSGMVGSPIAKKMQLSRISVRTTGEKAGCFT